MDWRVYFKIDCPFLVFSSHI